MLGVLDDLAGYLRTIVEEAIVMTGALSGAR